jgi:phosphatidylinositol 3-kinase
VYSWRYLLAEALDQLVKKYERGDIAKSDWLDKLAFRKMEEIHAAETAKSENLFLYIDMPRFDFPVVFSEVVSFF